MQIAFLTDLFHILNANGKSIIKLISKTALCRARIMKILYISQSAPRGFKWLKNPIIPYQPAALGSLPFFMSGFVDESGVHFDG